MNRFELTYKPENLTRQDAVGAAARRDALAFWTQRLARARRFLAQWEEQLLVAREESDRRKSRAKCGEWRREVGAAETNLAEVSALVERGGPGGK